jgi:hypothetical protein
MTSRIFLLIVSALFFGPVGAAPVMQRSHPVADNAAPISFTVVQGPPGACGPGCDRWIAAEGKIDNAAIGRFRKLMSRIGDAHLPIYLNSPGGNLEQALGIGNILREKKMTARVGRTLMQECGFEAQESDVCIKLKQSGRVLHGEVWTRGASCNSACPYLLIGAANREIAPDAFLAVHSPRVILNFTGGVPTREMRARALEQAMTRSDGMVAAYLKRMGVEQGLLAAARAVRFEDMHVLTREEIARFGIDPRQRVETPWVFEQFGRGLVYKTASERAGDAFRATRIQLFCIDANEYELHFQRPLLPPGSSEPRIKLAFGTGAVDFLYPPRKEKGEETWAVRISVGQAANLASSPKLTIMNSVVTSQPAATDRFEGAELRAPLLRLMATCPPRYLGLARASSHQPMPRASTIGPIPNLTQSSVSR